MSKSIARRFIQEIFNEGKIEEAEKFVTPDITYHGVFDQVRGLEDFKRWIVEHHKAFSDMHLIIEDDFAEANKVAIRWTLNLTNGKEFSDIPGVDIFHFEKDKIKEAWTIFDALTPASHLISSHLNKPHLVLLRNVPTKYHQVRAGFDCKETISSNVS